MSDPLWFKKKRKSKCKPKGSLRNIKYVHRGHDCECRYENLKKNTVGAEKEIWFTKARRVFITYTHEDILFFSPKLPNLLEKM